MIGMLSRLVAEYGAIVYIDDRMIVCYTDPRMLTVHDMSGEYVDTIYFIVTIGTVNEAEARAQYYARSRP